MLISGMMFALILTENRESQAALIRVNPYIR